MIRVYKSPNVPLSLLTTQSHRGEDVLQQLEEDHHKKCYLCERVRDTDFQVEHHRSQANHPHLTQEWSNLFRACGYCNGKKGNRFDNLLDPATSNVEDEILQVLDFSNKQAIFTPLVETDAHEETCMFLTRIHNGTHGLRRKKEECFFEHIMGIINDFNRLVSQYLTSPTEENQALVRENLQIDKECLGFKYWIVKNHPLLSVTFANDIVWNKP